VVRRKTNNPSHTQFENLRKQLIRDNRILSIHDLGGGSSPLSGINRKISSIAKTSLTPQRFSELYNRLIAYYPATKSVLELGTSFGINTLYLAEKKTSVVTTFEGCSAIADIARHTFEFAQATNITLLEGDINITLPAFLESCSKLDIIFMDANHRYGPTVNYFEQFLHKIHASSVVILDDIHYSREMELAWNEVRSHKLVYASADLYRCGILFFDPSLNKQHVVLQF
jgi:hypothetical protein